MKSIRIFKGEQGWLADFENDAEIKALFGTTILPTPFTPAADKYRVMEEIKKLNPGYDVYFDKNL